MKGNTDKEELQTVISGFIQRESDYMARVCAGIYPGNAELQHELMQQATLELLEVLHRWHKRNGTTPMPQYYFHRTWQNLCKKHYNSHKAYQLRHCSLPDQLTESETEAVANFQQLYEIMNHLTVSDRALIELYFTVPDMTAMASALGITPNHASVKLHRVVKKMRRIKVQLYDE